jgi:hypothetical protein
MVVVGAAACAGTVLVILSAGVGLKPILRPLMPFDDQAAEVQVHVEPPPTAVSPPPAAPVIEAAGTSDEESEPADRGVVPAPEPTRTTLDTPAAEPRTPSVDQQAPQPAAEPAEPAPIEEPAPVIEQPPSGGDGSAPPPPVELPPVEAQQVTRPVEASEDKDVDQVVELGTPPKGGQSNEPKSNKKGKKGKN